MNLTRPTQMCWICGKTVTAESFQRDEHGSAVHSRCYEAKLALAAASMAAQQVVSTTLAPGSLTVFSAPRKESACVGLLKTGTE